MPSRRSEVPIASASRSLEDHTGAVQLADQRTTPHASARHGWRVPLLIAVVLIGCLAVPGLFVLRHWKVGYFADYQAGYAAVSSATDQGGGSYDTACDVAVRAAYPATFKAIAADVTWPQNAQAFYAGCSQKRKGQPADVWNMHGYLTSGRD